MSDMRKLDNTDMKVVPVGLGCMGFSHAYGAPTQKQEAVRMIRKAFDMGYDFFDTAECYIGTNTDGSTSYNEELMKFLEDKAAEKNATKGQVSLAWMLCKKPYIIPIPGSRKEARIRENLGAKDVILTAEEIRQMDELLDRLQMPVYGQRAGRN